MAYVWRTAVAGVATIEVALARELKHIVRAADLDAAKPRRQHTLLRRGVAQGADDLGRAVAEQARALAPQLVGKHLLNPLLCRPLLAHVPPRAVLQRQPPRAREEAEGRLVRVRVRARVRAGVRARARAGARVSSLASTAAVAPCSANIGGASCLGT